jgi:flagellar motor switch protein FliM
MSTSGPLSTAAARALPSFDFRQAHSLSADQLRELTEHCGNLCRALQRYVPESTGLAARFTLDSLTAMTFDEYLDALPDSPILAICEFIPNSSPIIWQIDAEPAYCYMDAMLGGDGTGGPGQDRELTLLERALTSQVAEEFITTWSDVWPALAQSVPLVLEVRQTTGRFGTTALREPVVVAVIHFSAGSAAGAMRVALPSVVLRALLKQAAGNTHGTVSADTLRLPRDSELTTCQVEVTCQVGRTSMTLREVSGLQVGDLVILNRSPRDQMEVQIAGVPKWVGTSGLKDRHLAVRITARMET